MQKIIDNKLYDTDTAELLITDVVKLFRGKNGQLFKESSCRGIKPVQNWEARELVLATNNLALYTRLFGAPEEA